MNTAKTKTGRKKVSVILLCLVLIFALASCGGNKNPKSNAGSQYPIKAEFDPYSLHPGMAEGSDWTTSDVWYPVDSPDSMPMYFTYGYDMGYDDCLFVITWIDEEGYDYMSCGTEVSGMDLVNTAADDFDVDFIFQDALTAYDKVSGTLYSRANYLSYDKLKEALEGKTYVNGRGNGSFTLNKDGSAMQTYDGAEYAGTWAITADTVVTFFDEADASYDNNLQILHDRQGIYLYASSDYYYPQEEQQEAEPEEPAQGDAEQQDAA